MWLYLHLVSGHDKLLLSITPTPFIVFPKYIKIQFTFISTSFTCSTYTCGQDSEYTPPYPRTFKLKFTPTPPPPPPPKKSSLVCNQLILTSLSKLMQK